MNISLQIKSKAEEIGFAKCGLTRAGPIPAEDREKFLQWLEEACHGAMTYMARSPERRTRPELVLHGAHSLISVLINYYSPEKQRESGLTGTISRYAWGRDYHLTVQEKLRELNRYLKSLVPGQSSLFYVDTGPLLDKWWAEESGLGWVGKNANLLTPEIGSWVFVGEILTTHEFDEADYDSPFSHPRDRNARNPKSLSDFTASSCVAPHAHSTRNQTTLCGACRRCLDVCPTRAIVAPFVVDARLCISYLTIELRGPIPRHLRRLIGAHIFGCDDCQEVCPWNRFAVPTQEPDFHPTADNVAPRLIDLLLMTPEEFDRRFQESPIKRAKYSGFLRNVAVALGNCQSPEAAPSLIAALSNPEALVRQHVVWALGEMGTDEALRAVEKALAEEKSPEVVEEINLVLGRNS